MLDAHVLAQVHARAFNGHDVGLWMQQAMPDARVLRDGELLGQGPDAMRDGIEAEYRTQELVHARVIDLDGEPALAEFAGDEHNAVVRGLIRFKAYAGRLSEVDIDHSPEARQRVM